MYDVTKQHIFASLIALIVAGVYFIHPAFSFLLVTGIMIELGFLIEDQTKIMLRGER